MNQTTTSRPQLCLPGQTAAPEGPADMTLMYLMHHAFRRDLAAFSEAVPATPVEDRETWQALAARWELFSAPLHLHHHEEDTVIWPFLMARVDAGDRATLEAMEAEHAEIDPGLQACAAGFARLADHADADARAALAVRLTAVRESLSRHLRHEETETIALLQRVVTAEAWKQLEKELGKEVRLSFVVKVVPWVMHRVPSEARDVVLAGTGAAHRVLWRLTRARFEQLDRRAFRYLP
jgi:iron-sulfur cluster repair protein YtfE (RIC family)